MARLTIRIDLGEGAAFGPGKARLLELIGETGSIRGAAAAMEMSYRQAWLLVQAVESAFGAPVAETARGGAHGGGARLTALGEELLRRYRAVEAQASSAAKGEVAALARLATLATPQPRRRLKPRKARSGG